MKKCIKILSSLKVQREKFYFGKFENENENEGELFLTFLNLIISVLTTFLRPVLPYMKNK